MKARYGRGPLHLLGHVAFLVLAGYALAQVAGIPQAAYAFAWLAGAVVLHDFVLWPLYTVADRAVPRGHVNHVRVPAALSAVVALVYLPMLLQKGEGSYRRVSGLDWSGYASRWLVLTAVLFAISGLILAGRAIAARRRRP